MACLNSDIAINLNIMVEGMSRLINFDAFGFIKFTFVYGFVVLTD